MHIYFLFNDGVFTNDKIYICVHIQFIMLHNYFLLAVVVLCIKNKFASKTENKCLCMPIFFV